MLIDFDWFWSSIGIIDVLRPAFLFIQIPQMSFSHYVTLFSDFLHYLLLYFWLQYGNVVYHVWALKKINNCITLIELFVKMLHTRTGMTTVSGKSHYENLRFDEYQVCYFIDLKLSLLLYRIAQSMICLEHNRHVSSCTHQQHVFTTGMTAEEFTNIVHLPRKIKIDHDRCRPKLARKFLTLDLPFLEPPREHFVPYLKN